MAKYSRRNFIKTSSVAYLSLIHWPDFQADINRTLLKAGNTSNETERSELLRTLLDHPDATDALLEDLKKILPVAEHWAQNSKSIFDFNKSEIPYLNSFFNRPIRKGMYPEKLNESSPLFPFWCLYRGRLLIWITIQHGSLLHVKEKREANYQEAKKLLTFAQQAFPENKLISMYLGEPIPWKNGHHSVPQAPEWANLQRECLEKLTDIIEWWIEHRQLQDGQYGGGWGDDVEMWRWWAPVLIGFEDENITLAQKKLSEGLFQLEHMRKGYTSKLIDVEHTAEDSGDTITAMMHINPSNQEWKDRALKLASFMRDDWTGINQRGQLQFRSTYFSSEKVDESARQACDTVYHPRAVQPALLYWQRSHDPELTSLFTAWMDTWLDASMREERGKPAGIIPSAIHWPDGNVGGVGSDWWKPENYTDNPLYVWPSSMYMMSNTLLLTYFMTHDPKYLAPMKAMASFQLNQEKDMQLPATPGSLAWCVSQMDAFLPDTLAKYFQLEQDKSYIGYLMNRGNGYVKYRLSGNWKPLLQELNKNAEALRWNQPSFTSEARWTDRILNFSSHYLRYIDKPIPRFDSNFLYNLVTGDMGGPLYFPLNVVQWLTSPRAFAALVDEVRQDKVSARLFHFGESKRIMKCRVYMIKKGTYRFSIASGKEIVEEKTITRDSYTSEIDFELPPHTECRLVMEQLN